MLTPHINDKNRKSELNRRKLQPDTFGGQPLHGVKKAEAEAELRKNNANAKK